MKVILSPHAEKKLRRIPKIDQIAIVQKIRKIRDENKVPNEEKLQGFKDIYRIRIGDYRIVYKKTASFFYVVLIGHRKDIYKALRDLLE